MRKAFVGGNWPQVQETSNPYSLQVEQNALKEETSSPEQTVLESCGNWPQNPSILMHAKRCRYSTSMVRVLEKAALVCVTTRIVYFSL